MERNTTPLSPLSPQSGVSCCECLLDTEGNQLDLETLQLLATPGETSPWLGFYLHQPKTDRTPLRVQSIAQPVTQQSLHPMLESYLRFLRIRGCNEQAEEIALFAETESDHSVHWCHDKFGCCSIRISCRGADDSSSVCVITVSLPLLYPEPSQCAKVSVISCQGSPDFVRDLTENLDGFASMLGEVGSPVLLGITGMARQMSSEIPVALRSPYFGFCENCSPASRKRIEGATPQCVELDSNQEIWICCSCHGPAQLLPTVFHVDTKTRRPWFSDTSRFSASEKNVEVDCCICYADDASTMIRFNCGCWYCLPCFFRMCESSMETQTVLGALLPSLTEVVNNHSTSRWDWRQQIPFSSAVRRSIQQATTRSSPLLHKWTHILETKAPIPVSLFGIPCAIHLKEAMDLERQELNIAAGTEDSDKPKISYRLASLECCAWEKYICNDVGLLQLLPRRTFNFFNIRSLEAAVAHIPGLLTCPLPGCAAYPFISEHRASHPLCPYCSRFFCVTCKEMAENCTCESPGYIEEVGAIFADTATADVQRPGRYLRLAPVESDVEPNLYFGDEAMVEVVLVLGRQWYKCSLPLDGIWLPFAHYQIKDLFLYMGLQVDYLQSNTDATLLIFHGAILNPLLSLRSQYVYSNAYVFVVETFCIIGRPDSALKTLQQCGKLNTLALRKKEEDAKTKRCPICNKPVVHHLGHGCHIISSCHAGGRDEWCYACGSISSGHHCPKGCPLFCQYTVEFDEKKCITIERKGCECSLCVSCKPMRPCAQCSGCPACSLKI